MPKERKSEQVQPEPKLPELRQDLELLEMEPDDDGFPSWLIYDQANHKYFVIGWLEFEILARWPLGSAKAIVKSVNAETTLHITENNIALIQIFLDTNELIEAKDLEQVFKLIHKPPKKSIFKQMLHTYLFILIPLVSPDRFLEKTIPYVKLLFTRTAFVLICIIAYLAFYFTIRQWPEFIGTFDYLFTMENMVIFVLSVIFVKIIHELGHAYVAKFLGCKISTIGVAFLVLWPVMYTDATDVWKLKTKKQRIAVALAGIGAELVLAILATFLWSFAPEGLTKSILFFIATISWVSSLLININPLLRFDGYYFFSDFIGVENLQSTSFTVGKWKLREWLFKFGEEAPILYPKRKEKILAFYAYFTWIYRFFLFLSIAVLVYYFFFKVLGIFLMIVEVLYFILLPILGELKNYWIRRKSATMNKNSIITFSVLAIILVLFFVPWRTHVSAPAVLEYTNQTKLFTQLDGNIQEINFKNGSMVKKGQLLISFNNPTLAYKINKATIEINIIETRLRQEVDQSKELGFEQASIQDLQSIKNELQNLEEEQAKLTIYAPFSGKIFSNNQGYAKDVWLGANTLIGELINSSAPIIYAYVTEKDLHRIKLGSSAIFYPNEVDNNTVKLRIIGIDPAATEDLASPYLASIYGGDIAVTKGEKDKLQVQEALYRVKLAPIGKEPVLSHIVTGEVVIKGKHESYAKQLWLLVSATLIRESGF